MAGSVTHNGVVSSPLFLGGEFLCYHRTMIYLRSRRCVPCEVGGPPFSAEEIVVLRKQIPKWDVVNNHELKRKFKCKNFAEALAFVNKVGALAESEGHHPDIRFGWGYVELTLFTHAVGGLSENDFILAAKIDRLHTNKNA